MAARRLSRLKRPLNAMPEFVAAALRSQGVAQAYEARPPYQRNDYIGWITRARLETTRQRRLEQMLAELRHGGLYMNMDYRPKGHPDR